MGHTLPTHPFSKTQFITNPVELMTYEVDAGFDRGKPDGVFLPQSTADVVALVNLMRQHKVPLIARGAGTGLSGGAVAEHGGVIVNFARMNHVLTFDPAARAATVEPGVVNLKFDGLVKEQGLYYPPDPSSQRSSVIGGNLGMNAGGPHCFKYGVTTNYVTGVEVVLADGSVVRSGGRAFDYPEFDLTGLMVGSEGTLGIVTRVDLRLIRNPTGVKTMMVAFDSDEAAGAAVSAIIKAGLTPATLEMMDQKVMRIIEDYAHCGFPVHAQAGLIVEVDGYPASLDTQIEEIADLLTAHGGSDLRIARSEAERQQIWYGRKSAAGAFARLAPAFYIVDVTVPRSRLAEMLRQVNEICDRYQVRNGHVFHAGDGNLHPTMLIDPSDPDLIRRMFAAMDEIVALCIEKDGSITGEHGVGIEKRKFMPMMFSGSELSAMTDVKHLLDPHNLMNPGKIFPPDLPKATYATPNLPKGELFAPATAQEAAAGLAALSKAGRAVRIGTTEGEKGRKGERGIDPSTLSPSPLPPFPLSSSQLSGIHAFAPDDLYITVGAGTSLSEIQSFLSEHKMQLPIASPWPNQSIGSIVASNLNSPQRWRYGSLRDTLLATTVALADGRVIRAGRPVVKNVAGYDLQKLFVGSFGQLGLMCDLTFKLTPLPRARKTLRITIESISAGLALAQRLTQQMMVCSGLVLSEQAVYYTAEGLLEDVEAELGEIGGLGDWEIGRLEIGDQRPSTVHGPWSIVESPHSAVEVWASELSAVGSDEMLVRVGVPPVNLVRYWQGLSEPVRTTTRWLIDAVSGHLYARHTPISSEDARGWLASIRTPALSLEGYAVVMAIPALMSEGIDPIGYKPSSAGVMQKLKQKWDPAGILV